jgi:GT2 family glycosyltransferase
VVIPTRNRARQITACLAALAGSRLPHADFEVIVVDDGSDPALDLVPKLGDRALDLRLLRQPNAGPAKARNAGAALARGDLLVFTDDDCLPSSEWLERLLAAHRADRTAALGGHTANGLAGNPYATASQLLVDYLYLTFNAPAGRCKFFTSNNFAVPAQAFAELGGFHPGFPRAAGEDREFCDRWRAAGRRLVYVPEAVVTHLHDLDLRRFWIQHLNYGRGAYRFHRLRAARRQAPVAIEPLRFYLDLVRFPAKRHSFPASIRLSMLLALAQVANVVGFFAAKGCKRVLSS